MNTIRPSSNWRVASAVSIVTMPGGSPAGASTAMAVASALYSTTRSRGPAAARTICGNPAGTVSRPVAGQAFATNA
ncbi:MAG: hypothetical protein EBZ74_01285 [Planctomycetia bacterium]|nr:hypothetical protein [Planctomycetia bacterium]